MSDRSWQMETQGKQSDVTEPGFDPADFGFEEYLPRRFNGVRGTNDRDYLIFTPKKESTAKCMRLSMCEDTAEFVRELIGESVRVFVNDKGQILVCGGNAIKVVQENKRSYRRTINMTGLTERLFDAHGKFKRLYLTAKPYGKGNAMLFAPNGEKDRL